FRREGSTGRATSFVAYCRDGMAESSAIFLPGEWSGTATMIDNNSNNLGDPIPVAPFTIHEGDTLVMLSAIDLPTPPPPKLTVNFRYETAFESASFGSCDEVNPVNPLYGLFDTETGEMVPSDPPT